MASERWQRIEGLYHSALKYEPPHRQAYLENACGSDSDVRREVESLLKHETEGAGILNDPLEKVAADVLGVTPSSPPERLKAGAMIGPYRVVEPLGAGGMGEVYRATDTRLPRDVALKLLPRNQLADADRRRRFMTEARAISALNHPNIVTFHDLLSENGQDVLVLECVVGRTLDKLIPHHGLKLQEALQLAIPIADALAAAHQEGIVHRDLKPTNIIVADNGAVKLLDFGLAKRTEVTDGSGSRAVSMEARQETDDGRIIGTAAYMSPEQAEGRKVDWRSDIFSFGAVLHEMLTGQKVFFRGTVGSTLAAVIREEPELPANAPEALSDILRRCLRKNPARRLQSMADVRIALEDLQQEGEQGSPKPAKIGPGFRAFSLPVAVTAFILIAALCGLAFWAGGRWKQGSDASRSVRLQLTPPAGTEFALGNSGLIAGGSAISPDGRGVAFVAGYGGSTKLWLRPLDGAVAHDVAGTEGALFPFWSPDSKWIAFFSSADGMLKRVDVSGGSAVAICEVPGGRVSGGRGGTWNAGGQILFGADFGGPLLQVSAAGGAPSPLTSLDAGNQELFHSWPQFLPDGRRFIYFVDSFHPEFRGVYLSSIDRPLEKTLIISSKSNALFAPATDRAPDSILWMREGSLVAQPFDVRNRRLTGEPAPLADGVTTAPSINLARFSVAGDGTVVYSTGGNSPRHELVWFTREGKDVRAVGPPDRYSAIRISPDGKRALVVKTGATGNNDIWQIEFARGVQTRITVGGGGHGVWSPDSQSIVYPARPKMAGMFQTSLFKISANGAGAEQLLLQSPSAAVISDWSNDGRYILYAEKSSSYDLWLLPMGGKHKPIPFLQTPFREIQGQFSPDGNWVAYASDESGHSEIYVRSFPAEGGKWRISNDGGSCPRWSRDGKELFYMAPDKKLMVAPIARSGNGLEPGSSKALFKIVEPMRLGAYTFDVSPDGQQILAVTPASDYETPSMTVLLNWQAALKASSN